MTRFGVCVPLFANPGRAFFRTPAWEALEPGRAVDVAVDAEELGYDSVWVADHLMHGVDGGILEGWTTLSVIAGRTRRVALGTIHLAQPFRAPSLVAKMAATLDALSGGRLIFFYDCGWQEAEVRAYGLPWPDEAERIARMDEGLTLIDRLWRAEAPLDFNGQFERTVGAICRPKPAQRPRPPIWLGEARHDRWLDTVVRHADGWNSVPATLSVLRDKIDRLRQACQRAGRELSQLELSLETQVLVAPSEAEVDATLARIAALPASPRGQPTSTEALREDSLIGTPETVAARLRDYTALGVSHFMLWFLDALASWDWLPSEGVSHRTDLWGGPSDDPADAERLRAHIGQADALVVCHGSPLIDASILDAAPDLKIVGELEGDRFANRIDVPACIERGVRVTDTTHGSSLPVAEWALGLMLVSLRNAAQQYRRLIVGEVVRQSHDDPGFRVGELTNKTVGLIGLGHIGRRLIQLLAPFHCRILVHDPYVAKEVALAVGVQLTSLDHVMGDSEVVVCCAPITPRTYRLIGARELDLLRSDAVFVNVSRGAIVDPDALIARARLGDIRVGLDVFDPEPIPADSPIRELSNVFLSPHIAGVTAACRPRFFSFMVDELERFFAGHETMFDITPRVLANRRGLDPVTV